MDEMSLPLSNIVSMPFQENETSQNYDSSDNSLREWESGSDEDLEETEIPDTGVDIFEDFSDSDDDLDIIAEENLVVDENAQLLNENPLENQAGDDITFSESPSSEERATAAPPGIDENTSSAERTDTNTGGRCFDDVVLTEFLRYMNLKSSRSSAFNREKYDHYCSILRSDGFTLQRLSLRKRAKDNYVTKCRRIMEDYALHEGKLFKIGTTHLIPVVLIEDAAALIEKIHKEELHNGERKTWDKVHPLAHGISFKDVAWLLSRCQTCAPMRANCTRAPLVPIVSRFPFERIQMDLMDLSNEPSNGYKWILHLKDHFSKMSWLRALKLKHSLGIAKYLNLLIRHCGVPKMIQCDNGKEFKGAVTRLLRKRGAIMINGRPRHPQSQGLVEKGNGFVKHKIANWKKQNNRTDWENSLKYIARTINMATCEGLPNKMTPHEVMYGHKRRPHRDELRAKFSLSFSEISDAIAGRHLNIDRGEAPEATE